MTMMISSGVWAQVSDRGLSPGSNTARAFTDASVARDSGLNRPLDLLNDFYPAIEVTIADHDNVRRRPDFQEQDVKLVAKPSLAYRTNLGRHQFYAAYNGSYVFHQDLGQEDSESNAVNAQLGLDLTRRWDVDLFAGFSDGIEQRGISGGREFNQFEDNGIDSGPESVESLSYGADLTFGRKIGIITGVLGFAHDETNFEDGDLFNGAESSDRDRESDSVHFDLNWQFASKTSVFARVDFTETDYDLSEPNLDNDQTQYLVGLRFKPARALSGVASIGRTDREFDDDSRPNFDGTTYFLNLNYSITPYTNIGLNASNFIEEPGDENASFIESEFIGLSFDHALGSKFIFDAYINWIDDDFDIDREDSFVDWGLGLDYLWRDWLSAGIFYGEIDRESTLESVEFDDKFIGIRLRSDLRSLLSGRNRQRQRSNFFADKPSNLRRNSRKTNSSQ